MSLRLHVRLHQGVDGNGVCGSGAGLKKAQPQRISAASGFENWRRMILNNMKI